MTTRYNGTFGLANKALQYNFVAEASINIGTYADRADKAHQT